MSLFVFRSTAMTIMSAVPMTLLGALKPRLRRCKLQHTFVRWGFWPLPVCVCVFDSVSTNKGPVFLTSTAMNVTHVLHLQAEFECVNPKKLKKKNYKNSGVICFKQCQVMILKLGHFTLLDFSIFSLSELLRWYRHTLAAGCGVTAHC